MIIRDKQNIICILVFLFILVFPKENIAQLHVFKGKIVDKITNIPIKYAQIYSNKTNKGTITNKDGLFEYKYNTDEIPDTIYISHISYQKQNIIINKCDSSINQIKLDPRTYLLDEVNLFSKDSLKYYVAKSINALKKNYCNKIHLMSGYYRSTTFSTQKNNKTNSLVEVAFNLQDKGIFSSLNNIKYQILNMRRSDNNNDYYRIFKFLDKIFKKSNDIYNILENNPIRYYCKKDTSKLSSTLRRILNPSFDLFLSKITKHDSTKIFVINFSNRKNVGEFFKESGTLYINSKNFAIEKIITKCVVAEKYKDQFKNLPPLITEVAYKQINSRYYLSHIIKSNIHSSKNKAQEKEILFVNKYYLRRKEFERIKNKFKESKRISLSDKEYEYDKNFWLKFNTLPERKLSKKVISDLESKTKLEDQFINNSKN